LRLEIPARAAAAVVAGRREVERLRRRDLRLRLRAAVSVFRPLELSAPAALLRMESGAASVGPEAGARTATAPIAVAINSLTGAIKNLDTMDPSYLRAGENPRPIS